MPRVARLVVPGHAHHVTQRGNNRQAVFFTDDDRLTYLRLLAQQSERFALKVLAYCLMSNHVHLVAKPLLPHSLAKALGTTHLLYSRHINRLHGRSGHLWQNRFFSCPLDDSHELAAVRYVERNPVRARMVRKPWLHRWSSAAAHCGEVDHSGMLDLAVWMRRYPAGDWKAIVQQADDDEIIKRLRRQTFSNRPMGSDRFIAKLEAKLNRRLRSSPIGRPKNTKRK